MSKYDQYKVIGHISPQAIGASATPAVSQVVDTLGFFGGRLVMVMTCGAMGRDTLKCLVQESDDNSSFTTFMTPTDSDIDGQTGVQIDQNDDDTDIVFDIPLIGARKRYYKVTYTSGSGGGGKSNIAFTAFLIGKQVGEAQTVPGITVRANSKAYRATTV